MRPALLGRKIGMTQVYDDSGALLGVTVIAAGPCYISQIKSVKTDGYDAVQIGFEATRPHRAAKPIIGHAAASGTRPARVYRELRLPQPDPEVELGSELTVSCFEGVDRVDVVGTSKGKGFAGVMKRYGFRGQLASHGVERKHRSGGSIASHGSGLGGTGGPKKGKKMPGQMGNARCTSRHHKLVAVDGENGLLLVKGSVPGARGGLVLVRASETKRQAKE